MPLKEAEVCIGEDTKHVEVAAASRDCLLLWLLLTRVVARLQVWMGEVRLYEDADRPDRPYKFPGCEEGCE